MFSFYVNGQSYTVTTPQAPELTLLEYLRTDVGLTGSKLGCGEGGCGACTVMLSRVHIVTRKIVHLAVNACLFPLCEAANTHITTIEGLGSTRTRLHELQSAVAEKHGSQCGFCTPGIIMSAYVLYRNTKETGASREQLDEAIEGNLCRCTGYRPILEALAPLLTRAHDDSLKIEDEVATVQHTCGDKCDKEASGCPCMSLLVLPCAKGDACCRNKPQVTHSSNSSTVTSSILSSAQQAIFPPSLLSDLSYLDTELHVRGARVSWHRPTTLERLFEIRREFPSARCVAGSSEVGVELRHDRAQRSVLISTTYVRELQEHQVEADALVVGASTTVSDLQTDLKAVLRTRPACETQTVQAVLDATRVFAGKQIRNTAVIAGNLATASPISDLSPVWLAGRCSIILRSDEGVTRSVPASEFFVGYRRTSVAPNEIILAVRLPMTRDHEHVAFYKQARRHDDDIAIVNAALHVELNDDAEHTVRECTFAYGGAAAMVKVAVKTCEALRGIPWSVDAVMAVCKQWLPQDLPIGDDAPGGMGRYRSALLLSFVRKFIPAVRLAEGLDVPERERSAALATFSHVASSGTQDYRDAQASATVHVGEPVAHLSARQQCTGEAVYVDDMAPRANELHAALVTTTQANATILSVDASAAETMPGVRAFVSAPDVPGHNAWASDEEVFVTRDVRFYGQVVGLVVADSQAQAKEAARAVKIEYDLESVSAPSVFSIEQAIAAESFFDGTLRQLRTGDCAGMLASGKHGRLAGEIHLGGQEHFYLETQATVAVPHGEDGGVELLCSTQAPTATQMSTARVLGVAANKVTCRVKRLGGGFGGKESRNVPLTAATAVAAVRLNRPVRLTLDRDIDMAVTGQRHPFYGRYDVAYDEETGRIVALDLDMYSNGGFSLDLSPAVLERAMFSFDNCYHIEHLNVRGRVCRTNLHSFTAFRGFGGPQGMLIGEAVLTAVARKLGRDPMAVRLANLYREGDETPFGMRLEHFRVPALVDEVRARCDYEERRAAAQAFNRQNRYRKRGVAFVPVKFGISFTVRFLNQAGALVQVYTDGSVLLTHGGCEMGQGLHTKVVQVAADALGVPLETVHVNETSTATVPNTSPTAASTGSDLNGMAVLDACQQIRARLAPYSAPAADGTVPSFHDAVQRAYNDCVSLSATGFYRTPDIAFDWKKGRGRPFNYFSYGAAVSDVEIDTLTGEHRVLRSDIIMDVGKSLNPAVDIGQVEGAFVQGYGLFVLEESTYLRQSGRLFSQGPGFYKIPSFSTIPQDMRVTLLPNAPNERAIHSSKAVGEPPLFLASSIFFALEDAIHAARVDAGLNAGPFRLDSPASCERIRLACEDDITQAGVAASLDTGASSRGTWNITV